MSIEPDFIWIVPKESVFGCHLESLSDDDWNKFREDIALACKVDVEVDEEDEPGANRNGVYFDGPAFVFHIRQRRLGIINEIEDALITIRPITPRRT